MPCLVIALSTRFSNTITVTDSPVDNSVLNSVARTAIKAKRFI